MRVSTWLRWTLLGLMSGSAFAHLPPHEVNNDGHPSGIVTGGPIKPRISTAVGDYELVLHMPPSTSFQTTAVFWGSGWNDASYAGDRIVGLDQFYSEFDGSRYSLAMLEYFPNIVTKPGVPPLSIGYSGHVIDPSDTSQAAPTLTNAARAVCYDIDTGLIPSHKLADGHYFSVFIDKRRPSTEACGEIATYECELSSTGTKVSYLVSLVYDADGDPNCDVHDTATRHSPALASAANQAARIIADLHTDAGWTGWFDNNGGEIDDKCAWIFDIPFVIFPDNSRWKLQSLWSNKAYERGLGQKNREGQPGCISHPVAEDSPG